MHVYKATKVHITTQARSAYPYPKFEGRTSSSFPWISSARFLTSPTRPGTPLPPLLATQRPTCPLPALGSHLVSDESPAARFMQKAAQQRVDLLRRLRHPPLGLDGVPPERTT